MTAVSVLNQRMSGEPDKQSGHSTNGQPQRSPAEYQQREKQQQQQRNQQRPLLQQHEQQQ